MISTTSTACAVCSKLFKLETRFMLYRLKKGKTRFSCSPRCKSRLQSEAIREIRSTPSSRAKTVAQANKRWSDQAERVRYGAIMKGKPAAWHSARMAATLKTCLSGKMTKPEIRLAEKLGDAYAFVGDGSLMIGGLNPDFASKTGSRLVEMFGCYWHGCQKCFPGSKSHGIPLKQRLSTFKKHGYLCEIIWEHELEK